MNDYVDEESGKFDTKSLLEDSFLKNLGNPTLKQQISQAPSVVDRSIKIPISPAYSTEKMMLDLYEVRDGLIATFSEMGLNKTSQNLVNSINKVGTCIKGLGGEVDYFDPLANVSGLQSPKLNKSAQRVIENTKEAYNLGKIEGAKVEEDGKTITITFTGKQGNVSYKSVGTVTASDTWMGNEAIDYIYSPESGRMAVKTPNAHGQWIDRGTDDYKISWELFETDESNLNKEAGKAETTKEIKEEIKNPTPNDIDKEIGDFPIVEKNET